MEHIIRDAYTNFKNPYGNAFTSPRRIFNGLRNHYPDLTLRQVKDALSSIESYTLFKKAKSVKYSNKIIPTNLMSNLHVDLLDLRSYSKENDGKSYVIILIDCMSRYIFAAPIMNKSQSNVFEKLKKMLEYIKEQGFMTLTLTSDRGREFLSTEFEDFLDAHNIYHHIGATSSKAFFAESAIRTVKSLIFKSLHEVDTKRWIDFFSDLIVNYNASYHSRLGMTPLQAINMNPILLWYKVYVEKYLKKNILGKSDSQKKKRKKFIYAKSFHYKRGQHVRILLEPYDFMRFYDSSHSVEIFIIQNFYRVGNKKYYILKDLMNEEIKGLVSEGELVKVNYDENQTFKIEKIIKKKLINKVPHYFVKFSGYQRKFNKWVKKSDVVNDEIVSS
jgi:hypothetical protein